MNNLNKNLFKTFEKIFNWISEEEILKKLKEDAAKDIEINDVFEISLIYMNARKHKMYSVLEFIFSKYKRLLGFNFLTEAISQKNFEQLPVPISISMNEGVDSFLTTHFNSLDTNRYKKTIIKKLDDHGIKLLNNILKMDFIIKQSALDNIFEMACHLDHSREINIFSNFNEKCYLKLLEHYSLERVFKVMTNSAFTDEYIEDDLINLLTELERLPKEIKKQILPKKPKTIEEIHDHLSNELIRFIQKGIELNQELSFLNGLQLDRFTIEVPKLSDDLIATSEELKHCVHSYIDEVYEGYCNIINLKINKKLQYTLELRKNETGNYVITQFKGIKNESSMEGPNGKEIREEILKRVNKII